MTRGVWIVAMLFFCGTLSAQQLPERSLVRKGNRQYNKGNYERAIERYTQAAEAAPTSFEALYDLGNALYKAERYETAEQTMQRAAADTLRTEEERAEALYNLGNAQFKQQKYKEALESYKRSLLLRPDDQEAKYNYAYTKRLLDNQQQNGGGQNEQQQDQQNQQDQQDQQQNGGGQNQPQNGGQDGQKQPQNGGQQPSDPQSGENDRQPSRPEGDPERQEGEGDARPGSGMTEQEQQQILDAIQAQEDRTQEKLKEKQGVVVRGTKNW